MTTKTRTTGAMPGAGAMPEQVYPVGPAWAPYRLPILAGSFLDARSVGVAFEGEGGEAGGNGDAGATPPPTPPAGGEDQLGDAGKAALQRERDARAAEKKRADDLERQLKEFQTAGQSEQEKAIAKARVEAAAEVRSQADGKVRMAEVRRGLQAAGCIDADIAARSPEFSALEVDDDGQVPDLGKTIDAFKKGHAPLFARQSGGSGDGGARGGDNPERPKTLAEAAARHYQQKR